MERLIIYGFGGWVVFIIGYTILFKSKKYNNRPKCNLDHEVIKYKRLKNRTNIKR